MLFFALYMPMPVLSVGCFSCARRTRTRSARSASHAHATRGMVLRRAASQVLEGETGDALTTTWSPT